MSRFPDHAIRTDDLADLRDRQIVLTDVNTFRCDIAGDLGVIVDDERNAALRS